ncbi:MAG: thioredoxin family protein [Cyanobacteria bacterium P01_H01_bin.74]
MTKPRNYYALIAVVFSAVFLLTAFLDGCTQSPLSSESQKRLSVQYADWFTDAMGHQQAMAEQKKRQTPVIVYFYADWCPHCKVFSATILSNTLVNQFLAQYPHVKIAPDNGKLETELAESYKLVSFPTVFVVPPDAETVQIKIPQLPQEASQSPQGAKGTEEASKIFLKRLIAAIDRR